MLVAPEALPSEATLTLYLVSGPSHSGNQVLDPKVSLKENFSQGPWLACTLSSRSWSRVSGASLPAVRGLRLAVVWRRGLGSWFPRTQGLC